MQYITGNKFKLKSNFILDEKGFVKNKMVSDSEIPVFFVKTDLIHVFFDRYRPNYRYKLITHNSDLPINDKVKNYLEDENLVSWYGQNINWNHKKLISIPIGIANEIWEHGNENHINEARKEKKQKKNLIYCSFDISTNYVERLKCLNSMKKNNLIMDQRLPFKEYLLSLSESYFSLSPNGNGIDCHKIWESLYLKTIPVVTKSINIDFYNDLPIYVIEDWDKFDVNILNENLYNEIISNYDDKKIEFGHYINKIF
jgi:hypothetical protein